VTQTQPAAVKGKRGIDALRDPATNKSTAFTETKREGLGLTGLLDTDETLRRVGCVCG
jgi:hypothetical protein